MREFHYEISAKLLGIVFENQQPIFSRNKRGERTRGFDQRKGQITRGINRWFGVFLNRHMGKARFVKSCYWPNGKIVRDQEKFKWASDWTLSDDFDQDSFLFLTGNIAKRLILAVFLVERNIENV